LDESYESYVFYVSHRSQTLLGRGWFRY
jgi:hypothetical protein